MLSDNTLKDRPRDFLAATSLTLTEFAQLLPAFQAAYDQLYPSELTSEGQPRQRRAGGGANGVLKNAADQLLFILVYEKTHLLQTMHALPFGWRQPQTHDWMHRLLPVLPQALADVGRRPEREAPRGAVSPLVWEGTPDLAMDGTERRRQRPTAPIVHKEP
jgi:hypothetical protein